MEMGIKMADNYSFFSNRKCEYFPCHRVSDEIAEKDFNCLFCYCPLYLKEKCPGNTVYFVTAGGDRIKDCSQCIFPHRAENYGRVLDCLISKEEIVEVETDELLVDMETEIEKTCGFESMDAEIKKQHREILSGAYDKIIKGKKINILLKEIDESTVTPEGFIFGDEKIKCSALEKMNIDAGDVESAYLYTFGIREIDENKLSGCSLLEKYYVESLMIAATDVLREWLRKYIERKHSVRQKRYVTDSFGPGFYGMDISAVPKLVSLIGGEKVGVTVDESGNMHQVKSCIGIYLVTKKEYGGRIKDCTFCIGNNAGCAFCRGGR